MSDGGKGDKQRPGDHDAFADGYSRIFSGKPERGSFVQDPKTGKLVPKSEYFCADESTHYVMGDIQPYKSMITGEMITSRSQHREHLTRHNCFEIGNEVNHAMKAAQPQRKYDREAARRQIGEIMSAKGY